jgi:hypothetical protein
MVLAAALLASSLASAAEPWLVERQSDHEKAAATSTQGATFAQLGTQLGLEPSECSYWLTLSGPVTLADGTTRNAKTLRCEDALAAGQRVEAPNSVIALWFGQFGDAGRAVVDWRGDLAYLERRGFFVLVLDRPEWWNHVCTGDQCADEREFLRHVRQTINGSSSQGALHGLLVTAHGACDMVSDNGQFLHKADLKLSFHLGLAIFNSCHGDSFRDLVSGGGVFSGGHGVMVPPVETGHPEEIVKPGEQGTRPAPRRRPRRPLS